MLGLLEMWIRIQEAHLGQLPLAEIVWQIFHCVRAQARNVCIFARMQFAQRVDPVNHVVGHFHANLEAHREFVGKEFAQCDQKAAIAAPNVGNFHLAIADIRIQLRPVVLIRVDGAGLV